MAQHKTFFGRLLAGIVNVFGSIFKHVLEGAEKTFDELPEETKDALIHGSGIMDLLNKMVGDTPEAVRLAIKEQFPDVDEAALEKGLYTIAHGFNLAPKSDDLDDCIATLQNYISTLNTPVWQGIMHAAASVLAAIFAPSGTAFGAIESLMEYVYQTFFKKKS